MFREDGIYPHRGIDHAHILDRFGELALSTRRDLQSMSFLYKLANFKIDSPSLLEQLPFLVLRLGARRQPAFFLAFTRSNILLQSPIYRMCQNLNRISTAVDVFHESPHYSQNIL